MSEAFNFVNNKYHMQKKDYIPYTYYIFHRPTQQHYYGAKWANSAGNVANPQNFWVDYFTSSKEVKSLIKKYGQDSFDYHVTNIFSSPIETIQHEINFLTEIDAAHLTNWLNKTNGNVKDFRCLIQSEESNRKRSESQKNRPHSEFHRKKLEIANQTREYNHFGDKNPKWRGYWITPWGKFETFEEARNNNPNKYLRHFSTVKDWCLNNEKIISNKYISKEMQVPSEWEGKTRKEIGFNFEKVT